MEKLTVLTRKTAEKTRPANSCWPSLADAEKKKGLSAPFFLSPCTNRLEKVVAEPVATMS